MKRADAEKVCHHRVDRRGLVHATQYGGNVTQPRVWCGHAHCRDCHQECRLVKNKGGKLKVRVGDLALRMF